MYPGLPTEGLAVEIDPAAESYEFWSAPCTSSHHKPQKTHATVDWLHGTRATASLALRTSLTGPLTTTPSPPPRARPCRSARRWRPSACASRIEARSGRVEDREASGRGEASGAGRENLKGERTGLAVTVSECGSAQVPGSS